MNVRDLDSAPGAPPLTAVAQPAVVAALPGLATPGRQRARRSRRRVPPLVGICLGILAAFVICGVFADGLAPYDPIANDLTARLKPPALLPDGLAGHPLGTDALGRDLLSRLLHGARVSLVIGFSGTLVGLVTGVLAGLVAGFVRGPIDNVMMFLVDVMLSLPFLVIALTAVAVFGNSILVLVLLAGLAGWASYTRLTRGQVLTVREQPYIVAARAIGAPPWHIVLRHILPNIVAPLVVLTTVELTAVILLESSLSFLGLGVKPPTPAWGSMLGEGRGYLHTAWWMGVLPGLAIMLVTTSVSLVGDWLRDVLDPTLRGR